MHRLCRRHEGGGSETLYETIGTGDATNPQAMMQAIKGLLRRTRTSTASIR